MLRGARPWVAPSQVGEGHIDGISGGIGAWVPESGVDRERHPIVMAIKEVAALRDKKAKDREMVLLDADRLSAECDALSETITLLRKYLPPS